ncbi:MAG: hypothetical protein DRN12_07480 [Thermoplasmata archaeon]|nr:MAG: hypothetical protein DRN12_07480 [Thermoplasmata archaeon]
MKNINVSECYYHINVKYDILVIRYGELALKAKYTRRRFEGVLKKNISLALDIEGIPHSINSEWGRIYVETDYIENSIPVLKKIFGITSFSPAIRTVATIEDISNLAVKLSKELLSREKKFALRVTRTGEHTFSSKDIAVYVGGEIRKNTQASVDLTNPDIELFIEIRERYAYIFTERIPGPGGLPLGTQGTVIAYIDKPIALLAAWYILKRGCKTIFYNTYKRELLEKFVEKWYIPYPEIIDSEYSIERLKDILMEKNCLAIITAHTLSNDPIKTIKDLENLKRNVNLPILSPLLVLTPKEIEAQYKNMGI